MLHRFIGIALFTLLIGCKENPPDVEDNFDKEAMLKNTAETAIIPFYDHLENNTSALRENAINFQNNPDNSNLSVLISNFEHAYPQWNWCSVYEFGPAADLNLRLALNTFPVDTEQIELNISQGSYDLDLGKNSSAKGFGALDYLLHSNAQNLTTDSKRAAYMLAVIEDIHESAMAVNADWTTYKSEFISNTSSSAGSSISNLVNEINYEFELFKNARIGIPLGKKTLGATQVEKLEGFYSGLSSELAIHNLVGIRNAFTGATGLGLDDYLDDLDVRKDDKLLSVAIIDLFDQIESDLDGLDLEKTIASDPSSLDPLYNKIEQLVVLLKTDMPSQLGVQITYQDNDGD